MKPADPPAAYMDGCTHCPDHLGRVSHRWVCDLHDRACWAERHFVQACAYHALWALRIVWAHRGNGRVRMFGVALFGFWQLPALGLAVVGWAALMTIGWRYWRGRPRWDVQG